MGIPKARTLTWISIPAGTFLMGSEPHTLVAPFANEHPQHQLEIPGFRIARTPVTNAQYRAFVVATGHPTPGHWDGSRVPTGLDDHPVTYVDWHDAQAFCTWAGVRLPSEAEWEKAARGCDGRLYPWGNQPPDASRCNFNDHLTATIKLAGSTTPVRQYPQGAGPYGALDMAGNVWEWTSTLYRDYPYCPDDGREDHAAPGQRVVRGGTYNHDQRGVRCCDRLGIYGAARDVYIGFRVAAQPDIAPPIEFDWVTVPEGACLIGSRPQRSTGPTIDNEEPRHPVYLPEFQISREPITNAQYQAFVAATDHPAPGHWDGSRVPSGLDNHPVTYVDWHDAQAYCAWAAGRLPSEAEWEKAARGSDGRIYPWGDQTPIGTLLHYRQDAKLGTTAPVGRYSPGASPYGVLDMAGNVWEWVSSLYREYPYHNDDGREDRQRPGQRVLRGGSFSSDGQQYVRCAARSLSYPQRRRDHIGFRVVRDAAC